jgi:hypothetical protein
MNIKKDDLKYRDDEISEFSLDALGLQQEEEETPLTAAGDYGHDHTPTEESDDDDTLMEQPYENKTNDEKTAQGTPNDDGGVPPLEKTPKVEPEPESEPEPEPEPEPEKTVPIARLNKEIGKKQALEERLQQMEATLQQQQQQQVVEPQEVTIDPATFSKMSEALLDGKSEDAMTLFADMMKSVASTAAQNAVSESQQYAQKVSQVNLAQSTQAELLQQTAHEMVNRYSVLDDQSTEFNADLLEKVIDLRDDLIGSGRFHPHVALERAAALVMMESGVSATLEPSVAPQPIQTAPATKKVDIAAKVAKAAQQPSRIGGETASGGEAKKLDVGGMTDSEFDSLTADELRRMRGDFI